MGGVIEVCFGKMFKTFEQGASLSGTTRASLVNCQLLVLCSIAPLIHSRLVAGLADHMMRSFYK